MVILSLQTCHSRETMLERELDHRVSCEWECPYGIRVVGHLTKWACPYGTWVVGCWKYSHVGNIATLRIPTDACVRLRVTCVETHNNVWSLVIRLSRVIKCIKMLWSSVIPKPWLIWYSSYPGAAVLYWFPTGASQTDWFYHLVHTRINTSISLI